LLRLWNSLNHFPSEIKKWQVPDIFMMGHLFHFISPFRLLGFLSKHYWLIIQYLAFGPAFWGIDHLAWRNNHILTHCVSALSKITSKLLFYCSRTKGHKPCPHILFLFSLKAHSTIVPKTNGNLFQRGSYISN
jgi:hypothetical protein